MFGYRCKEPCSELLKCGHPCPNKCGEPHSAQCNVKVKIKLKCGHKDTTGCSTRLTTIPKCTEPCSTLLSCGHPCAGNCSECLHGRVHVPCQSKCGRILICGHECPEPCTKDCPPCSRPCENRCSHSACKRPCGQPCVLCIEKCDWRCEHGRCSRLCNEPCDRFRCNQECPRRLPCGHQCVGVCGEPCPKLCRVCNREELTAVFFGTEDEPDAKFVQLEDCPHAIEMTALDQYMDQKKSGSADLQLKKCPLCSVIIRRNRRYSHAINTMLKDMETVKMRVQTKGGTREELQHKQTDLRRKLRNLEVADTLRENKEYYEEKLNMASLSSDELICIENILNFLEHHIRWRVAATELRSSLAARADEQSRSTLREVLAEIYEAKSLESAIMRKRVLMSPQELTELGQEVTRFDLIKDCLQINHSLKNGQHPKVDEDDRGKLQIMKKMLKNGFALDKETEADAEKLLERLKKAMTGLGISDRERVEIVRAMAMTQGHWFKCPNGHIYAIGECGGAMEEGVCPDCQAAIGGGSHNLRADNRFAPEMDGATSSAYPGMDRHG